VASWLRRPTVTVRATIPCRKAETRISSPYEQSCASACPKPWALFRHGSGHGKAPRKKFLRFCPHNSLKRLDSDERIQGNPRKSNRHDRGISRRNSHAPRKSKPIARTQRREPAAQKANPTPSQPTAPDPALSLLTATVNCHFLPESGASASREAAPHASDRSCRNPQPD
jgi:hypothetical protein